ncbi:unnamed protein product [Pieris brassicae]|uniref:Uncharacterized protein n=1 Tax=Pieris brassicae TaxID=7116 RepID=A0A9P0TYV4_PIEBR|nr:unnamed protein product [Pieris brassicae]
MQKVSFFSKKFVDDLTRRNGGRVAFNRFGQVQVSTPNSGGRKNNSIQLLVTPIGTGRGVCGLRKGQGRFPLVRRSALATS